MAGLVLFLHGLKGDRHSWGAVPDFVRDSPLGNDFDVDRAEYDAKVFGSTDIETSARQILTKIETAYAEHDPIYLVGYSLGGLIAREVCRRLLMSGPDELLNRIAAVLTVGSPLEGARMANWLLRNTPIISPKVRELTGNHFDRYRDAIDVAMKRSAKRPKYFHIEIETDRVIAKHIAEHFTQDDYQAAVIPGSHRDFANKKADASYVADVLLRQIRNSQNSMIRPNIRTPELVAPNDLPDQLILIACSHTKNPGGAKVPDLNPAGWILPRGLRQRVIDKRSYVFSVLDDAKLADGFERGGNRKHQPANRDLKRGPDLGGVSVIGDEGSYLPAWKRYGGRFYTAVSQTAWESYHQKHHQIGVLIMSGLYGLIAPDEHIQNYDVHLTDTHVDSGHSVSSMWGDLFTEMLNTYIQLSHRGRKVQIVNLLCDEHYVDAVTWHKLSTNCSVFHLASPTLKDVLLLPPAGRIFDSILQNPTRLEQLVHDELVDLSSFGAPPAGLSSTQVVFESRVGASRQSDGSA